MPDLNGRYQVSNFGRVKSVRYLVGGVKEVILKPMVSSNNYLVACCWCGKVKKYLIHRLVAEAFIPNPDCLSEVNHIDEDKTNNVFLIWNGVIINII